MPSLVDVDVSCGFGAMVDTPEVWGRIANTNVGVAVDTTSTIDGHVGKVLVSVEGVPGGYDGNADHGADLLREGEHLRWFDSDSCDSDGWCWAEGDSQSAEAARDDVPTEALPDTLSYAQRWTFDAKDIDLCDAAVKITALGFEGNSIRNRSGPSATFTLRCS